MAYSIGVDLGGTNIKAVVASADGRIVQRMTAPTEDRSADWADRVRSVIDDLDAVRGTPADAVGLAAPGLAAPDGRSILWMRGRMEAVQGLDWTDFLGGSRFVPVLNDAHAALLGEARLGAAKGCRNAILLTLGTGVGGGAVVDGHLLRGHIGRAGHLGHISLDPDGSKDIVGTPGSLEDAIGECTLGERSGGRFATTIDLVEAHRAGDRDASAIWLRSVKALAAGIASLANVLDPETVVLGGGIARAGAALFAPLAVYLDEFEWRPTGGQIRVVPALLGEWAGGAGAACHALEQPDHIP